MKAAAAGEIQQRQSGVVLTPPPMTQPGRNTRGAVLAVLAGSLWLLPGAATAQPESGGRAAPAPAAAAPAPRLMEQQALELLRASGARLAASRALAFTATVGYEYPSRLGPPLLYSVRYEVLLQRPDRLRVRIPGDGPASVFTFDGTTMTAVAPERNLVARQPLSGGLEAALQQAFRQAAIYFPFTDLLVADPYRAMAEGVVHAFRIGPSTLIGGEPTEMVAIANKDVFLQVWIARSDQLPRRIRAVYAADPLRLRHQMDLTDWRLNPPIPAGAFEAQLPQGTRTIPFQRPTAPAPAGAPPPGAAPVPR